MRNTSSHHTSTSAARSISLGARCAYRSVIANEACPNNSRTVFRSTPRMTSCEAKSCLISCQRKFSISASFISFCQARAQLSILPPVFGDGKTSASGLASVDCSHQAVSTATTTLLIGMRSVFLDMVMLY